MSIWKSELYAAIMAARYYIVCFLEDAAQDNLIPGLLRRMIREAGLFPEDFEIAVRYNRGGGSLHAFVQFLENSKRDLKRIADLLVVGSDANDEGFPARRKWIKKQTSKSVCQTVIAAVPDPYIERWYLLDLPALSRVAGVSLSGALPTDKRPKGSYKKILRDIFNGSGVEPPLGGVEYGQLLASEMDLYSAGKQDHSLADFLKTFRAWLKQTCQSDPVSPRKVTNPQNGGQ